MTCNPGFGDHRFAAHGPLAGVDELPPGAGLAASRHGLALMVRGGAEYFRRGARLACQRRASQ